MLRKIVVLSLIFTFSCTHQTLSKEKIEKENDFSLDWKSKSSSGKFDLNHGVWSFFVFSRDISQQRIPFLKNKHALLRSIDNIPLHGNPSPLQVIEIEKLTYLDSLENTFNGPWWWDVLRIENGARAIAEHQNLFNHKTGVCLNMYRNILSEHVLNPKRVAQNVVIKDNALLPRNNNKFNLVYLPKKANKETPIIDPFMIEKLTEQMRKEFQTGVKTASFLDVKSMENNYQSYLLDDEKSEKWLLKEVSGTCADFHKSLINYSPQRKLFCFQFEKKNYSLFKIDSLNFQPQIDFIGTDYQLLRNTRAVCARLANSHLQLLSKKDIKVLASLLNTNVQFYNFLLRFFDQEYDEITKAYRQNL